MSGDGHAALGTFEACGDVWYDVGHVGVRQTSRGHREIDANDQANHCGAWELVTKPVAGSSFRVAMRP